MKKTKILHLDPDTYMGFSEETNSLFFEESFSQEQLDVIIGDKRRWYFILIFCIDIYPSYFTREGEFKPKESNHLTTGQINKKLAKYGGTTIQVKKLPRGESTDNPNYLDYEVRLAHILPKKIKNLLSKS